MNSASHSLSEAVARLQASALPKSDELRTVGALAVHGQLPHLSLLPGIDDNC